jgi:pyridoxamine 5'-phosphate oxidase
MDTPDLDPDPLRQFERWFAAAREARLPVPEAMALATATPDGLPSARMILLKSADERGFAFHTNYESRKGGELAANPRAALLFHWQPLGRQVRIEGAVERVNAAESEAYFRTRPLGSRLAAWASPQSRPLADRAELERLYAEAAERSATTCHSHRAGAACACSRMPTSSGSTATTASTTGSATSATAPAGRGRGSRPSRA